MQEFLQTVNWKTTGYAIGYVICKIIGGLYPPIAGVCEVIEPLIVAGGFISTADASRVQNIVRAVDVLAFKNKIDPAVLVPLDDVAATVKVP
jgi:hypothetical protein